MAKKNSSKTPHDRFVSELEKLKKELETTRDDLYAFMTGGIGPTQQAFNNKVNSDWKSYNFIVMGGFVYSISNKKKKKANGAYYCPCDICDLRQHCGEMDGEKHTPCTLMQCDTDEYFIEEGELVYDKKGKMRVEPCPWNLKD